MSDSAIDNSLIQRLAVQRLAAPGLLSRESLQRRYDELQHSPVTHGLADRLQQRFSPSISVAGGSLVWQRASGQAHLGVEATPIGETAVPVPGGLGSTGSPAGPLQRSALPSPPAASTVAQKLLTRQEAPGLLHVSAQRSNRAGVPGMSDPGALASQLHARYSAGPGDVAASGCGAASVSALRSVSRSPTLSAALAGGSAASVSALRSVSRLPTLSAAPSIVMRQHDAQAAVPTAANLRGRIATRPAGSLDSAPAAMPLLHADVGPAIPRAAETLAISRGSQQSSEPASLISRTSLPTVLARKAATSMLEHSPHDSTSRAEPAPEFSGSSAVGADMPLVSVTQPLVLRRMMTPSSQSSIPAPYPVPPTTNAIPRDDSAGHDAKQVKPPATSEAPGQLDVDWIADEVGRRLRQRLEIDRERRGIRQWR